METNLNITGMTCQNCVKHVREALESVPGVTSADVNLETGLAKVSHDNVDVSTLTSAVDNEGYGAQPA